MLAYLTNPRPTRIRQTSSRNSLDQHPSDDSAALRPPGLDLPRRASSFSPAAICESKGGSGTAPTQAIRPHRLQLLRAQECVSADLRRATRRHSWHRVGLAAGGAGNDFYKMVELEQPNCAAQPNERRLSRMSNWSSSTRSTKRAEHPARREGTRRCAPTRSTNGVYTQNCPGALTHQQEKIQQNLGTRCVAKNQAR